MKNAILSVTLSAVLAILSGCPTTALHGTYVWGQQKYSLNALQTCSAATELVPAADAMITQQIAKGAALGLWDAATLTAEVKRHPIGMCMIERPESCCVNGGRGCVGPYRYDANGVPVQAARKGGCSGEGWTWVSRSWPPVCGADWPKEDHCAATSDPGYSWKGSTLRDEVNHGLIWAAGHDPGLLDTDPRWKALNQ